MMSEYYPIIFYVGAVQGLILFFFLFSLKKNRLSNHFLGLLTLSWGILLFVFALQFEGFFRNHPHFLKTFSHIPFLFFPLLYLTVKYLVSKHKKFKRQDLFHFLPFVLSILSYSAFYFKSGAEKIELINSTSGYYYILDNIGDEIVAIQGIAYSIITLLLLRRYTREIKNYISNVDKVLIRGATIGTYILLVSWTIGSVAVNLEMFNVEVSVDLFIIVYLLIVVVIYWISYHAINSPEVFKLDRKELYADLPHNKNPEQDIESDRLNKQMLAYIKEEKPFLEPDLNLQELANVLNISRHQLSALINGKHQKNFYEFINYQRVEEVKKLMEEPSNKHLKIISLAYDAGFNSKASFNRVFKQITAMTPSQYQAEMASQ